MTESHNRIVVAGGGPAGLLAAGTAAEHGASVLLLEKMPRPGMKLGLTGKGRCNLTNIAPLEEFIGHFQPDGRFLRQAFHRFFSDDLLRFLETRGVATVTERGGRVFPESQDAGTIVSALVRWAEGAGVRIRTGSRAQDPVCEGGRVTGVRWTAADGVQRTETARALIVATGGLSYPGTGSTGDGYGFAKTAGHTVEDTRPALVPLVTAGGIAARMQGLPLKNVRLTVIVDGRPAVSGFGEMLFTHFGLSGPIVLTASLAAVDALRRKKSVEASIDLKPALDADRLDQRLQRDLREHGRMEAANVLKLLLPRTMIPVCLEQCRIDPARPGHQVTAEERKRLRTWLKDFRLTVTGHRPVSEAIVTAGGVRLSEVDPRTMESRLVRGLYFCGEVLDLQADTGGYNLQAAFSTGRLAGEAAARSVLESMGHGLSG
ncbi:MAG: NAD(P)/FAD-dependent oxidoreductase [bacterium]|nr:NAD(P)/FAD-dependent oxidoreductase [bacterium]